MSNGNKVVLFVEVNVMKISAKFQFHFFFVLNMASEEMIFKKTIPNLAFQVPWQIQGLGRNSYIW